MGLQRLAIELTRYHSDAETWFGPISIYMPVALGLAVVGGGLWIRFRSRNLAAP